VRVSFFAGADAYDRFMGRYSVLLAPRLADFAGISGGQRVLDVGCGPGALTAELVRRLGPAAVSAVDPSELFVAAARERNPGVSVDRATAEQLPFPDAAFDATLAQLVVHFMAEPIAGLGEMARVTHEDGVVAACVWDHAGGRGPLSLFWAAARELDPEIEDESGLAGSREGHLGELFEAAGLREIEETALSLRVEHASFEEWWEPYTLGVGPAGAHAARLEPDRLARLRERCRQKLPEAPFALDAVAWAARGKVFHSRRGTRTGACATTRRQTSGRSRTRPRTSGCRRRWTLASRARRSAARRSA
jgi:SAM-dependent methyltransferase